MGILSETIQTLLQQPDWRYKYTAVMALSQIGEYIDEPEKNLFNFANDHWIHERF